MDIIHEKDQFLQAAESLEGKLIGWNWDHYDNTRFVIEELLKRQGFMYPSLSIIIRYGVPIERVDGSTFKYDKVFLKDWDLELLIYVESQGNGWDYHLDFFRSVDKSKESKTDLFTQEAVKHLQTICLEMDQLMKMGMVDIIPSGLNLKTIHRGLAMEALRLSDPELYHVHLGKSRF